MDFSSVCLLALFGAVLATQGHPRFGHIQSTRSLGISGGTPTTIRKHPYQAALLRKTSGKLVGTGAIVGKRFILTTAYLAESYDMQVRVGCNNATQGGQLLQVEKTIIHEKYNYHSYEVALLKLTENIKYGKNAKAIRLASKEAKSGTSAVITGYGAKHSEGDSDGSLLEGRQSLIDRATCQTQYTITTLDKSNFCAYNSTVCACFEDGGAPLVQKNKLLGLNLGVVACCNPNIAEVYINVPVVRKWIMKEMRKEGFNEKLEDGFYDHLEQ